jgi:hypothetical protein
MARQLIDREALLKVINDHLETVHVCRNLHVTNVAVDPQRVNGGNWTTNGLRLSGNDHDQVTCGEAIIAFMRDLQERYDIRV